MKRVSVLVAIASREYFQTIPYVEIQRDLSAVIG
jgi:hypothetical protein